MDDRILYCSPFFLAAILIFIVALLTVQRLKARGGWYLAFVCLSATVWATGEGMLYLGLDIKTNILINKLLYFGVAPLIPSALLFGLSVFGYESWATKITRLFLFLIAAIIIILVWVNPLHKLIFSDYYTIYTGPFPMLGVKHGLLWWVIIFYHYSLTAILSIILFRQVVTSTSYHRSQAGLILVAVAFVWIINVIYVSGHSPVPNMDISPIAFVLVAGSMAWGFFRFKLLDILPVAKAEIFRGLEDAILVLDDKDRIIDMNPAAESMFKIKVSQTIGQEALKIFDKFPQLKKNVHEVKSSEICLMQEGQEYVYDFRTSIVGEAKGTKTGRVIALRNITERKQTEEALKESEERFRDITHSMADWVWEVDKNGKYTYVSDTVKDTLGYSSEELRGKTPFELMLKEERVKISEIFLETVSKSGPIVDLENWNLTKDGTEVCLLTNGVPIIDADGELQGYRGVDKDITSQKKLGAEKTAMAIQLRQAQKMESVGTLAGGIAHDFNNILSSVIGYTELSLDDVEKGSRLENNLQEVITAGLRARDLVKQILTFARQAHEEFKPVQVDFIAKEVLKLLRSSLPTTIEIRQNIESDSLIIADPTQVHQILMNLCTNAGQAMEGKGGVLRVGLTDVHLDVDFTKTYTDLKPGDYLKLSISDTGCGISPNIKKSIFDPYFTTKAPGEGTGMGLATTYSIVKQCGGEIMVESKVNKGSTFTVYLPTTEKRTEAKSYKVEALPVGTEQILFVDDELPIANMGSQTLGRLGYQVTVRTSSVEALALFRFRSNDFDLVITDMTMPNMTGDRLAVELMKIRPDIPVILCTGYSKKLSAETVLEMGIKALAYKPIVAGDLAKTVRKVLDEENS